MHAVDILKFLSVFLIMATTALCGCSSCEGDDKPGPKASGNESAAPLLPEQAHINQGQQFMNDENPRKAIQQFQKAFDEAYAKRPKAPSTWETYLKICEARAKTQDPGTAVCYDRFFEEAKDLKIEETRLATAYRWRVVLAIQTENMHEAAYYWRKTAEIEKKLTIEGRMPLHLQAYSAFVHAGVYKLKNDLPKAEAELRRAIELHRKSGSKDLFPLLDYYDKLALVTLNMNNPVEANKRLKEREELIIAKFGLIHPLVAENRLKRINVLLDMNDATGARAEWPFVQRILGSFGKGELPPEIDDLYASTFVRLDMHGVGN